MGGIIIGILSVVLGLVPWLLQQKGIILPPWMIIGGGWLAILAFGYCLYYPIRAHAIAQLQLKPQPKWIITLLTIPFLAVGLVIGASMTWWTIYEPPQTDLERQIVIWLYDLERPFIAKEQPNQDELFRVKVSLNSRVIYFSQQKNESKDLIIWTRVNVIDADKVPNEQRTQLVLNIRRELSRLGISHDNLNWPLQGVILSDLLTYQNTDRAHVLQGLSKIQSALGLIESLAVPARAS